MGHEQEEEEHPTHTHAHERTGGSKGPCPKKGGATTTTNFPDFLPRKGKERKEEKSSGAEICGGGLAEASAFSFEVFQPTVTKKVLLPSSSRCNQDILILRY